MINIKQARYINLGLDNRTKCAYYCKEGKDYVVYIDSDHDKTASSVVYGIKFENAEKAKCFAEKYIIYDRCEFDVFVHDNEIIIDPRTIDGKLKIECGLNEEMAKKLVKRFRKQNIIRLNRQERTEKRAIEDATRDFKGMKF